MECPASIVSLIFILNSLNLAGLVVNKFTKGVSKKITNIPISIQFITAYFKDFRSLKNEITLKKSSFSIVFNLLVQKSDNDDDKISSSLIKIHAFF